MTPPDIAASSSVASAAAPVFRVDARRGACAVVVVATLLGLALRVAAASGDFGIDEVWSLALVAPVHSLGEVFWGISHDNNHLLNSSWLYGLGPDRPAWAYRVPAIVLGTLTVLAVARLLARSSPAAAGTGAIFAAVALPLVDFGSEARGYAGLVLSAVIGTDACARSLEAALAQPADRGEARRAAWELGGAAGFGALCHLDMASVLAVLGFATLACALTRTRSLSASLAVATRIFLPAGLLVLPAVAALLAGVVVRSGFRTGVLDPFSLANFAEGYGGMLLYTMGLSDRIPGLVALAAAPILVALAARRGLLTPWSCALAGAAFVVLPLGVVLLRMPNVAYSRHFTVSGLVALLLLAEALGALWQDGPATRRRVAAVVAAIAAGGLALDAGQIRDGRGAGSATLALMRAEGGASYATDYPVMAAALLEAAGRGTGRFAVGRPLADLCRERPEWYLAVGIYDPRPDAVVTPGPPGCAASYRIRRTFPSSLLSGTAWTLYRRVSATLEPG